MGPKLELYLAKCLTRPTICLMNPCAPPIGLEGLVTNRPAGFNFDLLHAHFGRRKLPNVSVDGPQTRTISGEVPCASIHMPHVSLSRAHRSGVSPEPAPVAAPAKGVAPH